MALTEIGEMRQRVDFVNPTKTQNSSAGWTADYDLNTPFVSTFAKVEDAGGSRVFDSATGQDLTLNRKRFYVRHRQLLQDNLSIDTRIVYNSRVYQIEQPPVLMEERKKYYTIVAVSE